MSTACLQMDEREDTAIGGQSVHDAQDIRGAYGRYACGKGHGERTMICVWADSWGGKISALCVYIENMGRIQYNEKELYISFHKVL